MKKGDSPLCMAIDHMYSDTHFKQKNKLSDMCEVIIIKMKIVICFSENVNAHVWTTGGAKAPSPHRIIQFV